MNTDSPWIAFSTRQPQASDWDDTHAVETIDSESNNRHTHYDNSPLITLRWTHWRRVELPPLPPKEMTQKEKDWYHYNEWCDSPDTAGRGRPGEDAAWHAALAHERSHLGMPAEQFVKELREITRDAMTLDMAIATITAIRKRLAMLDRANKGNA